jgi:hypothetical protein
MIGGRFETLTARERDVAFEPCKEMKGQRDTAPELLQSKLTHYEENGHAVIGRSLADLVRITEMLGIRRAKP